MSIKVAFVGFRHGHVQAMYNTAQRLDYVDIVACVEPEAGAHGSSVEKLGATLTHETFDQVLADVDFDVLACADVYARRGEHVIKALEAGKHAVTDKPLCAKFDELKTIAKLCREQDLQVHVDLTMRYSGPYATLAGIVRDGGIGELSSCMVTGLHPMAYGSRPMWYFEEGKHGGTINDLMIHGFDMLRWATGKEFSKVIFADVWNRRAPVPFFQDSAQMALQFENDARFLGDCSYMAPEGGSEHWRFLLWGSEGSIIHDGARFVWTRAGEGEQEIVECNQPPLNDPFEDFVGALHTGRERWLGTEECIASMAVALQAQAAGDSGQRDMPLQKV